MIDFSVISTGSKGNAVVIGGSIMIDCGVAYGALKGYTDRLRIVLLTHRHCDHFKRSAVKKLAKERPLIRWGVPDWLAADTVLCGVRPQNIDILDMNKRYLYGTDTVEPFPLTHNAPNCGYKLGIDTGRDTARVVYATDTNSLNNVSAPDYDLYLIEANYSEAEITERIRQKQDSGQFCYEWDVLKNHLSREKADEWLYRNMGAASRFVYLHTHSGITE